MMIDMIDFDMIVMIDFDMIVMIDFDMVIEFDMMIDFDNMIDFDMIDFLFFFFLKNVSANWSFFSYHYHPIQFLLRIFCP